MTILLKMEDLDQYLHHVLAQFPKHERHVMCEHIRNVVSELERDIIRAGKKYHKKTTLQDIDINLEYLRLQMRKAHSLGYLTKKFEIASHKIDEVGRMIGGWLRSETQRDH